MSAIFKFSALLMLSLALVVPVAIPIDVIAQDTPDGVFKNPLPGSNDIGDIIVNVIKWLLGVTGSVAMLGLVYGGIKYILAAGNEAQATEAKNVIKFTLVGLGVVILSYVIISTVNTILTKP